MDETLVKRSAGGIEYTDHMVLSANKRCLYPVAVKVYRDSDNIPYIIDGNEPDDE